MKLTILSLLFFTALLGAADAPDVSKEHADYLKAVIALQGAQSRKEAFPKDVAKAEVQIDQAVAQAQQDAQKALAAGRAKCEAKKQILDDAAIKERMDFTCIEKLVGKSELNK